MSEEELEELNRRYGKRTRLLSKKDSFKCPNCGSEQEYIPHEKISKGEYEVAIVNIVEYDHLDVPINRYTDRLITFLFDCVCGSDRTKLTSNISLRRALQVLEDEQKLVESGVQPSYITFYT